MSTRKSTTHGDLVNGTSIVNTDDEMEIMSAPTVVVYDSALIPQYSSDASAVSSPSYANGSQHTPGNGGVKYNTLPQQQFFPNPSMNFTPQGYAHDSYSSNGLTQQNNTSLGPIPVPLTDANGLEIPIMEDSDPKVIFLSHVLKFAF